MASASDYTAARASRGLGAELEDDGFDADYSMIAEDDDPEELDYYALLGLSQKPPPTDAEIRSAFRNLSLSFHPDKQPPHLQVAAQRQFTLIQEAYDALINPQKRIVYDMLGADGVRQEWKRGGSMGIGGEAQRQEVGVKAMSPDQFKQWFLKTMKKRERKAVESMVGAKGAIVVGVNAQHLIRVDEDDDITIGEFNPRLASFGAVYQFKSPLQLPGFLTRKDNTEKEEEDQTKGQSPENNESGEEEEGFMDVTFNAGITGSVVRQKVPYFVTYDDREEEVELSVNGGRLLAATNIQLGTTFTPNLRAMAAQRGIWGWRPLSFLRDSHVTFEGTLLPERELKTNISRVIQPISGIQPITVTTTTSIKYPLLEAPPNFEIQASKSISSNKTAFCSWSSGFWEWPGFLDRFIFLGMTPDTMCASEDDLSSFQIGLISTPREITDEEDDDDEKEEEELGPRIRKKRMDPAMEKWTSFINVSPVGGSFIMNYERNIFSGKPTDDPVRSEWSGEGYFPMRKMEQARAVRLEVKTAVGPDLSIQWSVQGTRRVGEYTKMGLGMGIAPQGIMMSVSWSRLGQQIKIPVLICPANEATHEATVLATVVPWLTYCAIEFGYIRPRDRKKRRQAAALRHKELKKLIPKKRAESEQAVELMEEQVTRRQAREQKQEGLVITKAEYGYVPAENKKLQSKFPDARLIDVTLPVAALVDRSQLVVPDNTVKFRLIGFYDPAPMLPKRLRVWYTFQGREHFADVGDKEGLACPMRTHLL